MKYSHFNNIDLIHTVFFFCAVCIVLFLYMYIYNTTQQSTTTCARSIGSWRNMQRLIALTGKLSELAIDYGRFAMPCYLGAWLHIAKVAKVDIVCMHEHGTVFLLSWSGTVSLISERKCTSSVAETEGREGRVRCGVER